MGAYELFHMVMSMFVAEDCILSLVQDNWMSGLCVKMFITKALGYAIILGSVMVKVPQIIKLVKAKSGEGLSLIGVVLELVACMGTLAYSVSSGFPFSSYGETFFMTFQQSLILFFVFLYTINAPTAITVYSVFVAVLAFLLSPAAPPYLLFVLQASVIFLLLASRVTQAYSNFRSGGTGQLSLVTTLMQTAGSGARIFTSFSEVGDPTTIIMFEASFATNTFLLLQIFYYWKSADITNNRNNNNTNNNSLKAKHTNIKENKGNKQHQSYFSDGGKNNKLKRSKKAD